MAVKFGSKLQGALGFPYKTGPSFAAGSALPLLPGNTQRQHTPTASRCVLRTSGDVHRSPPFVKGPGGGLPAV